MNKADTIKIKNTVDAIEGALGPVMDALEEAGAPHKVCYKVRLALDELLTNVVSYAYEGREGVVELHYEISENPPSVSVTIIDEGRPFNPLEAKDPDLNDDIGKRKVGGLGLFIVKSIMDSIDYVRENNKNILTIRKTMQ